MDRNVIEGTSSGRRGGLLILVILLFALLLVGRYFASTVLEYQWWKEMNQLDTYHNRHVSVPVYGMDARVAPRRDS
jgi:hypothetical protein